MTEQMQTLSCVVNGLCGRFDGLYVKPLSSTVRSDCPRFKAPPGQVSVARGRSDLLLVAGCSAAHLDSSSIILSGKFLRVLMSARVFHVVYHFLKMRTI